MSTDSLPFQQQDGLPARPKVLFLHQGGELYGSDIVFYQVVRELSPYVEPIVVLDNSGPLTEKLQGISSTIMIRELGVLRKQNFNLHGMLRSGYFVIQSAWWLARYIKHAGISLVYSNTIGVLPGVLAARLSHRPHIWHIHEIVVKPKWVGRLLSFAALAFSDNVIANSKAVAKHLAKGWRGRGNKVTIVHNGLAVDLFDAAQGGLVRQEYDINTNIYLIGMVGRVHYRKGHDNLIEAMHIMKQAGVSEFKAIIVGHIFSGHQEYLELLKKKVSALGLEEHTIFCGYRSDIPEVMRDVDVVVVPSLLPESFGLVILEAMACAKPVIATGHGGTAEIVEDGVTGFLIPVNNPEALASRLMQLAGDRSLREHMGKRGRERLELMFSIEQFNKGIREVVLSNLNLR